MRTHPSRNYDFGDYDDLSREERDYLATIENEEKNARYHKMQEYKCQPLPERGIRYHTLPAGSTVPDIIRQQHWENFVRTPRGYDPQVVAEFYGCMHPPTYCSRDTVVMRGITIRLSARDICAHHGLIYKPQLERSFGLSGNEIFQISYNPVVASSLRRSGYQHWDGGQRYCLLKSDLHPDMGFMMLFIKASLKPSSYITSADQQVAEVLYSLQHNLPLDAGQIIWHELLDAGVKLDGKLPFPCLITDFCENAGIAVHRVRCPEDFFDKHLTIQIRAAQKLNARRLRSGEHWQIMMATQEEDENDEEPEYQPEAGTEEHFQYYQQPQQMPEFPEDTPPYIMQLSSQMQGLRAHVDTRFDYLNERLDWFGVPRQQEDAAEGRNVRVRGQGGASGSGQGGASGSGQGGASGSSQGRSRRRPRNG